MSGAVAKGGATSWNAVARAGAACALVGAVLAARGSEWRTIDAVLRRRGLEVIAGSVAWVDAPGVRSRRALMLARTRGGASDVYVATARTGGGDRIIALRDVSNLTRSPDGDEASLVVRSPYAAYVTRAGGRAVAFTLLDTRGEPGDPGADRAARLRLAVTRWQQTGRARGYGSERFQLARPVADLRLAFVGNSLVARGDGRAMSVDLRSHHVVDGADGLEEREHQSAPPDNWITWAVDVVRRIPWIGSSPIAWAEHWASRAQHVVARARTAALGDTTQRDVVEDLADILHARNGEALEGRVVGWPPAAIHGTVQPVLAHEGEWAPLGDGDDPFVQRNPHAPAPMAVTFVRTDPLRRDSRVYIALWDPRQVELHVAPGSEEPMGATGETGTGAIPRDAATMSRLVGGFNGAFQAIHGEFGVYGEGTVLLPAKPYAATIALLADGNTGFGTWPPTLRGIPDDIVEFRQNLTPMIDEGVFNPWNRRFWGGIWGRSNQDDQDTARSGICMTREGFVGYFWGHALTPQGLADAMLGARCRYGVHLDMNGANTGFEMYRVERTSEMRPLGRALVANYEAEGSISGLPDLRFRARRLVRRMSEPLPRYIRRDPRDFFYLLLRPTLPGPALAATLAPPQAGEGDWHVAGLGDWSFPWPLARTRIRPDEHAPDRWVNLVRVDARRVRLAPPESEGAVVARFVSGALASQAQLRIGMSEGAAGPRWTIGTAGDGIAVERLAPGATVQRGACVDRDGYLVLAVTDRAMPDLIAHALARANCQSVTVSPGTAALALPSGAGVAGETLPRDATPLLALVEREFPLARRMFPEVTPVGTAVWLPAQRRQVRYTYNPGGGYTMRVHLVGQAPFVLPMRGLPQRRADAGVAGSAGGTPGGSGTPGTP